MDRSANGRRPRNEKYITKTQNIRYRIKLDSNCDEINKARKQIIIMFRPTGEALKEDRRVGKTKEYIDFKLTFIQKKKGPALASIPISFVFLKFIKVHLSDQPGRSPRTIWSEKRIGVNPYSP